MNEDPTQDISQKYETKPTLETVMLYLAEFRISVEKRFDAFEKRFDAFESETSRRFDALESEMKRRFDGLERKLNILNKDMLQMKADVEGLDERVEKLEESRA